MGEFFSLIIWVLLQQVRMVLQKFDSKQFMNWLLRIVGRLHFLQQADSLYWYALLLFSQGLPVCCCLDRLLLSQILYKKTKYVCRNFFVGNSDFEFFDEARKDMATLQRMRRQQFYSFLYKNNSDISKYLKYLRLTKSQEI